MHAHICECASQGFPCPYRREVFGFLIFFPWTRTIFIARDLWTWRGREETRVMPYSSESERCSVLQCVAVCCSVLQCVAVCIDESDALFVGK